MVLPTTDEFELAPLESFDAKVFLPVDKAERKVAGLILCLALSHNDLKDVVTVWSLMNKNIPPGEWKATPQIGQFWGMHFHIQRQYISTIYALINCLRDHQDALAHPLFLKIVPQMNRKTRELWGDLMNFVAGKTPADPTWKVLTQVRNCVTYHYDPAQLMKGFQSRYDKQNPTDRETAFVSRGATGGKTRFYFADGAAQEFLQKLAGGSYQDVMVELKELNIGIVNAIHEIVVSYVHQRGGAWRDGPS